MYAERIIKKTLCFESMKHRYISTGLTCASISVCALLSASMSMLCSPEASVVGCGADKMVYCLVPSSTMLYAAKSDETLNVAGGCVASCKWDTVLDRTESG